uniref:Uncharacterized protein n=1 Tax=Sphaerodactylus townsendi TaxID=933632 RepID=A0ACB8EVA7_9SAUR
MMEKLTVVKANGWKMAPKGVGPLQMLIFPSRGYNERVGQQCSTAGGWKHRKRVVRGQLYIDAPNKKGSSLEATEEKGVPCGSSLNVVNTSFCHKRTCSNKTLVVLA